MNETKGRPLPRQIFLLILCLIVSLLYGFPHLLWLHENQWDYQNTIFITSFKSYDANLYLSQIKDVYDGNYRMSHVYIAEYKDAARPLWPVFPIYLAAFVGKMLHLEVQHLMVVMDFFLPPLIFILLYTLLVQLSKTKRVSALGAFVLVTLPHLARLSSVQKLGHAAANVLTSGNLSKIIPGLWHIHAYHDGFARPINPQLTVCFLLAALSFFLRSLSTSGKRNLALTIFFGLLTSYSYVYFSSFLYVFWCVFILFSLLFRQAAYAKTGLIALTGTLIGAAPFWISAFGFSDAELSQSSVMTRTHTPIITPQVMFMLACSLVTLLLIRSGKMRQLPGIFTLASLLAAVLALNHRILSGIEIQSWHYETHVLPQITLIGLILIATDIGNSTLAEPTRLFRNLLKRRSAPVRNLLYLLAFLPAIFSVAAVQRSLYYGFLRHHLGYNQQLAPALNWLNTHTEKESVVLCSIDYHTPNVVIPIYTHNNLYVAPLMGLYPVIPASEIRDRMYNIMALMGLTDRQDFERYTSNNHQGMAFEEYQQKLGKALYRELASYRADYLFYGPRERASFRTAPKSRWFLKLVYTDPDVTIYRIQ